MLVQQLDVLEISHEAFPRSEHTRARPESHRTLDRFYFYSFSQRNSGAFDHRTSKNRVSLFPYIVRLSTTSFIIILSEKRGVNDDKIPASRPQLSKTFLFRFRSERASDMYFFDQSFKNFRQGIKDTFIYYFRPFESINSMNCCEEFYCETADNSACQEIARSEKKKKLESLTQLMEKLARQSSSINSL